ncbi:DUF499 domain-containing protein [Myxococcota bacterium]|nr:DUF499 domain-containing protein [Myxococcota bacterium]
MSQHPPTLFDACTPRADVLASTLRDESLAADLSKVIDGSAIPEYLDPQRFFSQTHPTQGLKTLLKQVLLRLQGSAQEVSSIFRLDTQFGGGKTHGLIALYHAANGMRGVPNPSDFLDPSLLPKQPARVAAFDGENADPTNGITRDGIKIYTPWGFLAYQLAGIDGYSAFKESDVSHTAPGAETFAALLKTQPSIILLDEMAIYLRRVKGHKQSAQFAPFLSSLFKAIEGTPQTALIFSLAVGKDLKGSDAYNDENTAIAKEFEELESVSARKATLLEPTSTDETALVLQKRLFSSIDTKKAAQIVKAYTALWKKEQLDEKMRQVFAKSDGSEPDLHARFLRDYPFHPDLMHILKDKLSTFSTFQRVRGMLRLLSRAVSQLWQNKPNHTFALHPHHIDPGHEPIRAEILTRLQLQHYEPAIRKDISHYRDTNQPLFSADALAQILDREQYQFPAMPPYASHVARTIFWHTLAFNNNLRGLSPEQLTFAALAPSHDSAFLKDALHKFQNQAAYLNDDPHKPLSFLSEANLNQIIRQEESHLSEEAITKELDDHIETTFSKPPTLDTLSFPGDPSDVPDDPNRNKPRLLLMNYDTVPFSHTTDSTPKIPARVRDIFLHAGTNKNFRQLQNHLVFLLADKNKVSEMKDAIKRHLALRALNTPDKLKDLSPHQQKKVKEDYDKSSNDCTLAIQNAYRHLFYPSASDPLEDGLWLTHVNLAGKSQSSNKPGKGQEAITQALKDCNHLYFPTDHPPAPNLLIHKTTLAQRGTASTSDLRNQFYKNPKLPFLLDDNTFLASIRKGIEDNLLVYRYDDLTYGPGDPSAAIRIDENAFLYTLKKAEETALWPRVIPPPKETSAGKTPPPPEDDEITPPPTSRIFTPETFTLDHENNLPEILRFLEQSLQQRKARSIRSFSCQLFHLPDFTQWLTQSSNVFKDASPHLEFRATFYAKPNNSEGILSFEGHPDDIRSVLPFLQSLQSQRRAEVEINATFSFDFSTPLPLPDPQAFSARIRPLEKVTPNKCKISLTVSTKDT